MSRHVRALSSHPVANGSTQKPRSSVHTGDSASSPQKPAEAIHNTSWRILFQCTTKQDLPLLILALAASVGASIATPAQAYLIGKFFDGFTKFAAFQLSPDQFLQEEQRWILGILCVACGTCLFHAVEYYAWILFGERQAERVRRRVYSMLSKQEMTWYDTRERGVTALLPQLEKQVRDMQLAISQPMGTFIATIATALASLGQAFYNSWSLTLVTLATSPLVVFALWTTNLGMQEAIAEQLADLSVAQKISLDALMSIDTVKCFSAEETELRKYSDKIQAAARVYYRIANKTAMQMGCMTLLVQAMFVQTFYYGGVLISKGEKSSAEVVTTFFSAVGAFQAAQAILPQLMIIDKGRYCAAMLSELFSSAMDVAQPSTRIMLPPGVMSGEIIFDNVDFCYPAQPSQRALKNVSIRFPAGELTFVIGKSGSGKSTIGQLLVGFYTPDHGRILLDGIETRLISSTQLRSIITLVEQTSVLFNDTIQANVKLGRPETSTNEHEINQAIEFALLQSLVSDLPHGINTVVGKGGASLSGGQCQRVALARARLRDTPVLILDESTSALDQISRDLVMAAMRRWRQGRTTIVITHDIRQVEQEDYALIMQDGMVVQEGRRRDMEEHIGSPFHRFAGTDLRNRSSKWSGSVSSAVAKSIIPQSEGTSWRRRHKVRRSGILPPQVSRQVFIGLPFTLASLRSSLSDSSDRNSYEDDYELADYRLKQSPQVQSEASLYSSEHPIQSREGTLTAWLNTAGNVAMLRRARQGNDSRKPLPTAALKPVKSPIKGDVALQKERGLVTILRQVWPVLSAGSRVILLLGLWGGSVHAVCSPVFAYVLSKLLGLYAVPTDHSRESLMYSLIILGMAFGDGAHFYLCRYMLERAGQNWVDTLRREAMRRLLYQPKAFFDRPQNKVLAIAQDLDRSCEEMRNLLGRFVGFLYIAAIIVLSSITWALTVHWKMTLFALVAAPYIAIVTYIFATGSERMEDASDEASRDISSCLEETFSNVKTIRSLNLEHYFEARFNNSVQKAASVGLRRAAITGLLYGLSDSASTFSIAFVFYVGTRLVKDGDSVASVLQVFVVLVFAITNTVAILGYIPQIGSAKVTAARVQHLSKIKENSHERFGDVHLAKFGTVELINLTFAYESRMQQPALKDITLTLPLGRAVAIVGGSGSGKSTVAKLILKLYDVPNARSGSSLSQLKIAGRAISSIETSSLRRTIGVVSQSSPIFPASIAENIAYGLAEGSPFAKHENIVDAADQAGILDFIKSLPDSFETRIGDGGMGLSGGQAQRIAIARALVRKPSALLLDEATSALDVESIAVIKATIRRLIQNLSRFMTVIIITHSRDMMEVAEDIVVLDNGCIVETGAYSDLIKRAGPLANLLSSGVWNEDAEH